MLDPPFKTSANGRKLIELWEGLYLYTYGDQGYHQGVPTIGYGHTTAAGLPRVYYGMTITQPQADAILASDLGAVEADVNHHVTHPINQNQFDALVSFDFNTGALDRSNVLINVNLGHYPAVQNSLGMWVHGGGHIMPGLVRRRHAEWAMFNTGTVVGP